MLSICHRCSIKVVAQPDGSCPACGSHINKAPEELIDTSMELRHGPNIESATSDQPPVNVVSLSLNLLQEFDAAWQLGTPELAEFVDRIPKDLADVNARRQLLVELVHRDLEYRWGQARMDTTSTKPLTDVGVQPSKLTINEYACRFPELLSGGGLPAKLKVAEFRARRAAGEEVQLEEYLEPDSTQPNQVVAELANEVINLAPNRPTACSNLLTSVGACSVLILIQIWAATYLKSFMFDEFGLPATAVMAFLPSSLTMFLVGFLMLNIVHGKDSWRVVAFRPPGVFHTLVVLLLVLPALIAATCISITCFGSPRPPMVSAIDFSRLNSLYAELAMEPWGLSIIVGCILPAISEELFF